MCSVTLPFEFELSVDHNELSILYDTILTSVLSVEDTLGQWINTHTAKFFSTFLFLHSHVWIDYEVCKHDKLGVYYVP